jgi:hypothetical protein
MIIVSRGGILSSANGKYVDAEPQGLQSQNIGFDI